MQLAVLGIIGLITGLLAWRKGQNIALWLIAGILTPFVMPAIFIALSRHSAALSRLDAITLFYLSHACALLPLILLAFMPSRSTDADAQARARGLGNRLTLLLICLEIITFLVLMLLARINY